MSYRHTFESKGHFFTDSRYFKQTNQNWSNFIFLVNFPTFKHNRSHFQHTYEKSEKIQRKKFDFDRSVWGIVIIPLIKVEKASVNRMFVSTELWWNGPLYFKPPKMTTLKFEYCSLFCFYSIKLSMVYGTCLLWQNWEGI